MYCKELAYMLWGLAREVRDPQGPVTRKDRLGHAGTSQSCCPQAEFPLPQGSLSSAFKAFQLTGFKPTQIIRDNLLYLKSTDRRC